MRPKQKTVTWRAVGPIIPLVVLLTAAAFVWYLMSGDPELSGEELHALLAGNTVEGLWGETERPYRHFVGPDGAGLTSIEGAAARDDAWYIDNDGAFCALLAGGEQGCYRARPQQDFYLWIDSGKGLGYPFRVLPGRQLEPAGRSG